METRKNRILLVEDNRFDRMAFERLVKSEKLPYEYSIAGCILETKEILAARTFDVIISDYYLGDGTLFDLFKLIHDIPVIVTTGAGSQDIAVKAMKEGAYDYLIKDVDRDYLKILPLTVENAIKHKQAEERYRMLSHAVRCINDSIYITDMNDRIMFVNKVFCHTYGYREEDILGKRSKILWSETSLTNENARSILSKIDQYGWKSELVHKRKDGTEFPISLARSIIKDEDANDVAVVGVAHDITEHKRAAEELQKAKEAAEAATHAKTEFLANMSHEIRTPLNAVIGMAELLSETELKGEQRDYLNVIQTSSDALLCLINDILDISKIQAGQMELEKRNFNLREVVEQAADIFGIAAQSKGLELICHIEPDIPCWLVGDPTRLRQILINLVGNAIKFTESGEICLKVLGIRKKKKSPGNQKTAGLHFLVSDTGIGISRENQAAIFDKFSQADNTNTRKFGGTGLGLSISKSLVELMSGRMWLESQLGHGSTFHFEVEMPYGEERATEPVSEVNPDFTKVSILVVDDNRTNRLILYKTLDAWGFKVQQAASGTEALSILKDKKSSFDLVLLDYQMPVMDGIAVAREIRSGHESEDIKIIMLSSWDGLHSKLNQEVNIVRWLTKPVKQSHLLDVLVEVLRSPNSKEVKPTKPTNVHGSKPARHEKILLVEDNVDNQNLARRILEKAGYSVDIAETGELAVAAVKNTHYDLILMDVQMPLMDGFTATREIRTLEAEQNRDRVPIIALTAHALKGYRERCLQNGMDEYLSKPYKKGKLLQAIRRWLEALPVRVVEDTVALPTESYPRTQKVPY